MDSMPVRPLSVLALAPIIACVACTSIRSRAVRTGAATMAPYSGPVAIFAAQSPPVGSELGEIEVHAAESEAAIETLVPVFVRRAAGLGGNAAVIDEVSARFEIVPHPYAEAYSFPCGFHGECFGTRMGGVSEEVIVVSVRGRAFLVSGQDGVAR